MTMWDGKLLKENELSKPAKIIVGGAILILLAFAATAVVQNAAHGMIKRPWAFAIVLIGFGCFLFPKVSVVRKKKLVSFGTRIMNEDQANFYRVGYYLMGLGLILTFL